LCQFLKMPIIDACVFTVEETSSQYPTVRYGRKYLHSKYSPFDESNKIATIILDNPALRQIILINPGLNYLQRSLLLKDKTLRVLSLYSNAQLHSCLSHGENTWSPATNLTLQDFLLGKLDETELGATKIHALKTYCDLFPEETTDLLKRVSHIMAMMIKNSAVLAHFQKKWFCNTIRNILNLPFSEVRQKGQGNALLLASGPSLSALTLPDFGNNLPTIYALPSSLRFVRHNQIPVFGIVQSDGGFWAGRHLENSQHGQSIFLSLRSMVPLKYRNSFKTYIPFSTTLMEQFLWNLVFPPVLINLQDGPSVALPALQLLSRMHDGNIFIAGLDCATHDIQAHVLPHTFQDQPYFKANRICSAHHQQYALFGNESPLPVINHPGWYSSQSTRSFAQSISQTSFPSTEIYQINPIGLDSFLTTRKVQHYSTRASPPVTSPVAVDTSYKMRLDALLKNFSLQTASICDAYAQGTAGSIELVNLLCKRDTLHQSGPALALQESRQLMEKISCIKSV